MRQRWQAETGGADGSGAAQTPVANGTENMNLKSSHLQGLLRALLVLCGGDAGQKLAALTAPCGEALSNRYLTIIPAVHSRRFLN